MFRRIAFAMLCVLPGAAHAEWVEASSGHFRVYSNERSDNVQQFATDLERFDKALRVRFGMDDPPVGNAGRLTVYVVGSIGKVATLAQNGAAAGFYSGRAGASVAYVPRATGNNGGFGVSLSSTEILLHEYTHHFMLTTITESALPAWFVEGFAETYATAKFEKDGGILLGHPPGYRAQGLFTQSIAIDQLLTRHAGELPTVSGDTFYGRGWLLTHYLTFNDRRRGQIGAYIKALNSGKAPLAAAQESFGDLRTLNNELDTYLRTRLPALRVQPSALSIGPVTIRTLTGGEAAIMPIRIRSEARVHERIAGDIYRDALKIAADWPQDSLVQDVLAHAAFDAKEYAAAEAAADRAIAVDPKLLRPWLTKAKAQMERASAAGDSTPATWAAIRRVINAANRIDPEDPRPLVLFYTSFVRQGIAVNTNAKDALLYAYVLAPQDDELRIMAGAIYLADGNLVEARRALAPIAYDPHGKKIAALVADVLVLIDRGDATGAAAKLLERSKEEESARPPGKRDG